MKAWLRKEPGLHFVSGEGKGAGFVGRTHANRGIKMTKDEAADLQAKWKQRGDPRLPCEHQTQELALLAHSDDGSKMSTYHCLDCGEAIERPYEKYAT